MFTDYSQPRPRAALNTKLCRMVGQPISGRYMGQPFTGTVTAERMITTRPYDIELTVTLAQPLTVFGHTRAAGEGFLLAADALIRSYNGNGRFPTSIDGF